ncbi:MAG: homocysteine S-methyltransferase family protein [Deltaproteobacteria bacterium]|nr:homocysteine S-methyltransferase family protein [Deltaproteobacteria bacterium]MBW2418333.1 homocysteine S-methyltransferase family protein [Deltaproteobacteria bacterium]
MTDNPLIRELLAEGTVLSDGAWGTELQKRGLRAGETPDFLNLSHPERVEAVARAYVDAGSRVVLTNTFRANRIALAQHPEVDRVAEVNRAGVEISRRAADGRACVFASMGPSGKLLLTGKVSEAQLHEAFDEQARAHAEAGADAIVVETMTDLAEAKIAIEAAKATGLPVVASMVFDSGKQRDRTMMGVSPEQAAEELTRFGANVVGANCGTGIEKFVAICASMATATHLPIWVKANAGLPEFDRGDVVYPSDSGHFAGHLPALLDAGAGFVGGCCGTSPEYIAALRGELNRLR